MNTIFWRRFAASFLLGWVVCMFAGIGMSVGQLCVMTAFSALLLSGRAR